MSGLVYLPDRVVANNPNLTSLTIWHCHNLTHLVPSSLGSSLEYLKISSCESLRELPNDLHRLQSLKTLIIDHCLKLKSIPHQSGGLISLEILEIKYCQELTTLPIDMLEPCATKITSFTLRSLPSLMNLSEVIACLPRMTRLCDLTILDVPKLMTFPKEFSSVISSLQSLRIGQFSDSLDLVSFNDIFQVLQSLRCLILYGHECWEFLPDNLQYLTTLEELRLYDFGLTEALPDWLGNFSSLQVLHVEKCKKLMHLPSKEAMQRLTKLQHLEISDCPLLQERCNHQQSSGSDNSEWSKISHIPRVYTK